MDAKFGAQTFFALKHDGEICGSNGLPLTPKSISILGKAQFLKTVKHKYLAKQLDFIRWKHERIMMVSEYYPKTVANLNNLEICEIVRLSHQMLIGLSHIHQLGIVHRMLTPENVLLDGVGDVKLFNFGLYYMTDGGKDVAFPIGIPKYTAPEVYLVSNSHSSPNVDTWSVGIIVLELLLRKPLWPHLKLAQSLRKVISLIHSEHDATDRLIRELDCCDLHQALDPDVKDFLQQCLIVNPEMRKTPRDLLTHPVFTKFSGHLNPFTSLVSGHPLDSWKLPELYHLWQLAGGDVQTKLKKGGLIRMKPPILSLPKLVVLEGTVFGKEKDEASMLDLKVVPLSLETLVQRLNHIPLDAYYPLLETKSNVIRNIEKTSDSEKLPLVIRERDIEYQFHRIVLFKRLLQSYPYKEKQLREESVVDIPSLYRGKVWAALLGVKGDIDYCYQIIDKKTPAPTDRQIEVDIPRCHQYNELLSSKTSHAKLKRILKAWVISNPQYVYWQGLDSLCAPFLYLNFNREARAYGCLSAFIKKYLRNFFLRDNYTMVKEYLAKFSHLITYHDPSLASHLRDIGFTPELFTIPWFLTMFSHVFPLHKIFHLWDKLLLQDASYPLFIGFSVLQQLRNTLLASGFNECILLFSDLPEIDIEKCVSVSTALHNVTPKSITFRKHQSSCSDSTTMEMTEEEVVTVQKEYCPRISNADFISLITTKHTRGDVLTVDVRPMSEYVEACVPNSINIPMNSVDFSNDDYCSGITLGPELSVLRNSDGKTIVAIGNNNADSAKFSEYLALKGNLPKVCHLHNGISSLKNAGILSYIKR